MKMTELLAKKKNQLKKNKKGFTLVEIIVVLAIIAILAAVTVPSIIGFVGQAKEKVMIADARASMIACQMEVSETFAANTAKGSATVDYSGITKKSITDYLATSDIPTKVGFTASTADGTISEFAYQKGTTDKVVVIHANKGAEVVETWPAGVTELK